MLTSETLPDLTDLLKSGAADTVSLKLKFTKIMVEFNERSVRFTVVTAIKCINNIFISLAFVYLTRLFNRNGLKQWSIFQIAGCQAARQSDVRSAWVQLLSY